MESALTKACILKIQNFEGPFDLLFHLIEKNKINIYDIPVNEITDQYMDYLFAMQEMDLEIASEFLVMAATLLHIKSKMLLPSKDDKKEDEADPREELVTKLVQYKKFKKISEIFKEREQQWNCVYYKLPEAVEIKREDEVLELSPEELVRVFKNVVDRNRRKINKASAGKIVQILQIEKVSLRSKMKEIIKMLKNRLYISFSDIFPPKVRSKMEIVTGFLAMLELTKLKKVVLKQKKPFSEIIIYRNDSSTSDFDFNENKKYG